jgi:hypothetical protein
MNKEFWDERYSSGQYIYGIQPNGFFREQIEKISAPGKLILPGEGEGRNAVFAASLGWLVDAFDQSHVAKTKAEELAKKNKADINYTIVDLSNFNPPANHYNAAAIIFVHFAHETRRIFHKKIIDSLIPGGIIILELFSKNQHGKSSGGPQDTAMLCSVEEIAKDFEEIETILLEEKIVFLNEGDKHRGEASVVRFAGKKIK